MARNKFVLKKESGHPGYTRYSLISTVDDMKFLADSLVQKVSEFNQETGTRTILSREVTIAHGKTEGNSLDFEIVRSLEEYNQPPSFLTKLLPYFFLILTPLAAYIFCLGITEFIKIVKNYLV